MKNIFILSLLTAFSFASYAQSPGGVASGLAFWLKANAGTSSTTDGDSLSYWNDQSPNNNDATQSNASYRPIFKANQINGHPAVRNTSGTYMDFNMAVANTSEYSIFLVVKRESSSSHQYIVGIQSDSGDGGFNFGFSNSNELIMEQYGEYAVVAIPSYAGSSEIPVLLEASFDLVEGKDEYFTTNGSQLNGKNEDGTTIPLGGDGNLGRGNGSNPFIGLIAEVIAYDRKLTGLDLQAVYSYLNIKYGVDIPVTYHRFYNNSSYGHDIFGIGKSASSGLNQTTSRSLNSDDILEISNPTNLGNSEYLVIGNNDGSVSFGSYAGSNCTINQIMGRVWNSFKSGDPGNITLRFDMSSVSGFTPSELMLLVDRDGDGFDDEIGYTGTYSAPYFEVSNLDLPETAKITLATGNHTWYAIVNGDTDDAIWSTSLTGTPQTLPSFCEKSNLYVKSGVTVNNTWSNLTCNYLTVGSGAIFNAGSGTVNINNDLMIYGAFNSQTATVVMNHTSAQTIGGSGTFNAYNLICNNSHGITISSGSGGVNARGYIYVNAGTLTTNGKLTLTSDVTSTGMIAPLTSGSISGDVTVQRYSNRPVGGWYMLASPVQNMTVQDWNDDIITTGFVGSDFPPPGYTFNNVQYYNEPTAGGANIGYVGVTNVTDALIPRRGYYVYMNSGVMNLDVTGTIYSGDQSMPVSYTDNGGSPSDDGWNLLANPYPCTIDWNSANWTKTNINNAVYVWNPSLNQFSSYVGGVGSNGGSRYIPSSQGFFVVANADSPELTLRETCKSLVQGNYKSGEEPNEILTLSIEKGNLYDETILTLNNQGTLGFESEYDAYKLRSPMTEVPYMSTISTAGHDLSINSFAGLTEEVVIPIRIEVGESGEYNFSHHGLSAFANGACIALEDLLTGMSYPLNEYASIQLTLQAGNTDLRFQLRIGATRVSAITNAGCPGLNNGSMQVIIGENSNCNLSWYNQMDELVHEANSISGMYELTGLEEGPYTLKIGNNGICGTTEFGFVIGIDDYIHAVSNITPTTCPNTANGSIDLQMEGGTGVYSIQWSNGAYGNNLTDIAVGEYTAFIEDSKGCKTSITSQMTSEDNISSSFETLKDTYELKNGAAVVNFYNTSENASFYKWNFGDITIDNYDMNPTHVFNRVGKYDVVLTASNGDCEVTSTKSIQIKYSGQSIPEMSSEIIGTLTDEGAQLMFFFNEPRKLKITAYSILGQQLIEPIVGVFERESIQFSEKRYAANALIEVLDMNSGERTVIRLGR